ncbi:MAG: NfeD family protein [Planctomycetota bacterium]
MHFAILLQAAPATPTPPAAAGDTTLMTWGVILLASALAMLIAEMIVPSGGLISLAAAVTTVAGLICLFLQDTTLGWITTVAVLIATPFIGGFMLKIWPHTPVGRWLILASERGEEGAATPRTTPTETPIKVGDTGRAKTQMRPVGTCVIGGRRIECLAESGMIDAGSSVRVVDVDGNEIRVRAVAG